MYKETQDFFVRPLGWLILVAQSAGSYAFELLRWRVLNEELVKPSKSCSRLDY